jgi:hypothetical protein
MSIWQGWLCRTGFLSILAERQDNLSGNMARVDNQRDRAWAEDESSSKSPACVANVLGVATGLRRARIPGLTRRQDADPMLARGGRFL